MKLEVRMPEVVTTSAKVYVRKDFLGREIVISHEVFARTRHAIPENIVLQEERTETRAVVPECGYWPVFTTPDGTPVSPERALVAFLDGEAELLTDIQDANQIVHDFARAALLDPRTEEQRYARVLTAASWADAHRMKQELLSILGYDEDDDLVPNTSDKSFLTTAEVARIFRVDELTVRRWSGNKLPAALRIGKKYLFRADAIANVVHNAGPAHKPAAPAAPVPAKPRPKTKVASNNRAQARENPAKEGRRK
jgi:hypothetical protein